MRSVTGAHGGTGMWLLQRGTAVVLALGVPWLAWRVAAAAPLDYAAWRALFATQTMRLFMLTFTAALTLHAWIGMRDILMDYVRPLGLRLALYLIVIVTLVACVIAMAAALWGAQ